MESLRAPDKGFCWHERGRAAREKDLCSRRGVQPVGCMRLDGVKELRVVVPKAEGLWGQLVTPARRPLAPVAAVASAAFDTTVVVEFSLALPAVEVADAKQGVAARAPADPHQIGRDRESSASGARQRHFGGGIVVC